MCVLIRNSVKICKDLEQSVLFSTPLSMRMKNDCGYFDNRESHLPAEVKASRFPLSQVLLGAHRHLGRDAPTLKSAGFPI